MNQPSSPSLLFKQTKSPALSQTSNHRSNSTSQLLSSIIAKVVQTSGHTFRLDECRQERKRRWTFWTQQRRWTSPKRTQELESWEKRYFKIRSNCRSTSSWVLWNLMVVWATWIVPQFLLMMSKPTTMISPQRQKKSCMNSTNYCWLWRT